MLTLGAAELVNDPFTDGSRTNITGGDLKGLVYYRNSTGATLTIGDDSAGIGTGNALFFSPSAEGQKVIANFPVATLASAGAYIRLTFDFRFDMEPPDSGDAFRLGLYDSNNNPNIGPDDSRQRIDGQSSTIRFDDKGYGIALNPAGSSFTIRKENAGDDILSSSTGLYYFSALTTSIAGKKGPFGTSKHTLSLLIIRQANGDLDFVAKFDDFLSAIGTLAAATVASEGTYTLDEFALGFSSTSGSAKPIFVDNLRIVHGSAGAAALVAPTPAPDSVFTVPSTIPLAATASDPDGVARVEFYDGRTKIGEATSPPYTFDWTDAGPGVHSLTAVLIDNDGESTASAPVDIRVTGGTPDEFDLLRGRWLTEITGGTSYNLSDPDIANYVSVITSSAQSNWNNMLKTGGNGRPYLWSDLASTTNAAHVRTGYSRLRSMALAWATTGSSLQGNAALLADILGGLDWMNVNRYNENVVPYDGDYDWEIGAPQNLTDIVVLLYDQLSATRFMNQMRAIERFVPTADYITHDNIYYDTGANRADKARVFAVRGVLVKDSGKLFELRDSLSALFVYTPGGSTTLPHPSGDGYYRDGSFIQHQAHPYNCGYGGDLIRSLGLTLGLIRGSTWDVTDPNVANFYRSIYDSYDPFIFRGAAMDSVRGRKISFPSEEDHVRGHIVIGTILQIADFAPAVDALAYKQMAKAWIQADTFRNFLTNTLINTPLPAVLRAKTVLADSGIAPRPELVTHRQFPSMDRVVHWRPGFAFAVGMSSSRIYNYESFSGHNLHGWHAGDGATYLYNSDLDEYSSSYWPTVNPYRLAGTTVDTRTLANSAQESTFSPYAWVGGAEILGLYGASGMELSARDSTLVARKSWFMFDDEIVALGSGITSTDNRTIETIIENRRLKVATSTLTVDGVAKPASSPWSETMSGVGWAHLEATGGYVFPGGATIKGLRGARTGAWQDINSELGSATPITRDYATLWFDHGSNPANAGYRYILLPNRNAAQTGAYAVHPHAVVLENSAAAHGVREQSLGLTAANFWEDGTHTVGLITSDKKSAVLVREASGQMGLSVSDPTQLNTGVITVELARGATGVVSHDPRITILQLSPIVRFTADVNGAYGQSLKAAFALPATTPPTIAAPEGGFTPLALLAGVDGTAALPDYTAQAVTGDDVGVTLVTQSPASGATLNPGVTQVTLTAFDADGNSASLAFNVTVTFAPIITAQPQSMTAAVGRNAQFTVAAVGPAPLSYQWSRNGVALTDGATVTGATTPTLNLTKVSPASAGSYSVTVSSPGGNTGSDPAVLTVDASAPSGTIVSDAFTDESGTNPFGGDLLGLVWYRNNTGSTTLTVADDASVAPTSKALFLNATTTSRGMLAFFPLQTLASGQTLTLSFDFRFTTPPADNSQNFRFGLFNSNGTQQTGDANVSSGGPGTREDDRGYGIYTNAGAASSAGTRVFVESPGDPGTSNDILGSGAPGAMRPLGSGGSAFDCGTSARHTATLQITRQANGNVRLEGWLDAGTHALNSNITLPADQFYSFDTVAFSNGGALGSFLIDNLTVTTNNDATPPMLSPATIASNNVNAAWARAGDTVTLTFTASEPIQPPGVMLLGAPATAMNPSGNNWLATAVVGAGTPEGTAAFSIVATDIFGNAAAAVSSTSNGSSVAVDKTAPQIAGPFSPLVLEAGAASTTTLPDYTGQAMTTDNFGVTSVTQIPTPGTERPLGLTQVTLTARDAAGNSASTNFDAQIGTPLQMWRQIYFGTTANIGNAADTFDFDLDGLANLVEFAFGLNPTLPASMQLPQPQRVGGNFVVSFTQPAGVNGISYGAEWSTTLSNNPADWTPILDSDPSTTGYTFSVPIGANPKMFMRFRITSP